MQFASIVGSGASSSGMDGGAIAGIVIGVLLAIVIILVILFLIWKKRSQTPEQRLKKQQDSIDKPLNGKRPEPNAV